MSRIHGLPSRWMIVTRIYLTGKQVKDVYAYNPVKCVLYLRDLDILVAGLDGGKLEGFDFFLNKKFTYSVECDSISCLAVSKPTKLTSSLSTIVLSLPSPSLALPSLSLPPSPPSPSLSPYLPPSLSPSPVFTLSFKLIPPSLLHFQSLGQLPSSLAFFRPCFLSISRNLLVHVPCKHSPISRSSLS